MPSGMLADPGVVETLHADIDEYFTNNMGSVDRISTVCESFKVWIRGVLLSRSVGMLKRVRTELSEVESKLDRLETDYTRTQNKDLLSDIHTHLQEFNKLASREIQYISAPIKARRYAEGNKVGRTLSNLLKQDKQPTLITSIQTAQGDIRRTDAEINGEFFYFYKQLYSNRDLKSLPEIKAYLGALSLPTLSEEERLAMDQPITADEITEVIKALASGRAPGSDGLGAEFYKEFHEELVPVLMQVWEEALDSGILPPTLREAIITVHPKPRRPPQDVSS